jgi:hypothetical protein
MKENKAFHGEELGKEHAQAAEEFEDAQNQLGMDQEFLVNLRNLFDKSVNTVSCAWTRPPPTRSSGTAGTTRAVA